MFRHFFCGELGDSHQKLRKSLTALARVQVLREADLNGFERRVSVRRNTQSDLSKGLKDQCLTISMPEICQTAPNNVRITHIRGALLAL